MTLLTILWAEVKEINLGLSPMTGLTVDVQVGSMMTSSYDNHECSA